MKRQTKIAGVSLIMFLVAMAVKATPEREVKLYSLSTQTEPSGLFQEDESHPDLDTRVHRLIELTEREKRKTPEVSPEVPVLTFHTIVANDINGHNIGDHNSDGHPDNGHHKDDHVSTIPLPATIWMLAIGLVAIVGNWRRSKS